MHQQMNAVSLNMKENFHLLNSKNIFLTNGIKIVIQQFVMYQTRVKSYHGDYTMRESSRKGL